MNRKKYKIIKELRQQQQKSNEDISNNKYNENKKSICSIFSQDVLTESMAEAILLLLLFTCFRASYGKSSFSNISQQKTILTQPD